MGLVFFDKTFTVADLPHPKISESVFLVVEEALRVAWDLLRTNPRPGFNLLSATEDVITQELYEQLYDEVFKKGIVNGFDSQIFADITRAPKVRNYDGSSPDKMPDMRIKLFHRDVFKPSQDGLFIECKPVDSDHSVGVHYCDKGIIRFICGDYAWAMIDAMMIGYTRSGYTISSKLATALNSSVKEWFTVTAPFACKRSKQDKNSEVVHISQHSRAFSYIETGQQAPNITLRHLWLRRD